MKTCKILCILTEGKLSHMSKKYFLTFFIILIVMVSTSALTINKLFTMNNNAREIAQTWVPSIQLMGWMNGAVSDVPHLVLAITLETDAMEMSRLENEELNPLLKQIEEKLSFYEKNYIINGEEEALYKHFKDYWRRYLNNLPPIIAAGKENDFDLANQMIKNTYPIWWEANNTINEIIKMKNEGAQIASLSSFKLFESTILLILFLNLIAFILIVIVTLWISSKEFNEILKIISKTK